MQRGEENARVSAARDGGCTAAGAGVRARAAAANAPKFCRSRPRLSPGGRRCEGAQA